MNTIYPIGSCLVSDVLATLIDDKKALVPPQTTRFNGRISSSYVEPGPIAARLQNEMGLTIANYPRTVQNIYNDIVKETTAKSVMSLLPEKATVLADFHYELFPFAEVGNEQFLVRDFLKLKQYFPGWLTQIVASNLYFTDNMSTQQNLDRFHLYRNFKDDAAALEIVALDNCWATRVLHRSQIFEIFTKSQSMFFQPGIDYTTFAEKTSPLALVARYMRVIKQFNPHWSWLTVDNQILLMDPDHYAGLYPVHLHKDSLKHIATLLLEKIQPAIIADIYRYNKEFT